MPSMMSNVHARKNREFLKDLYSHGLLSLIDIREMALVRQTVKGTERGSCVYLGFGRPICLLTSSQPCDQERCRVVSFGVVCSL